VCGGACEPARVDEQPIAGARRAAGELHRRGQGIRRPLCRETAPRARSGDRAQPRARADRGPRAVPAAWAQARAPGEKAHRAPDLPESPRGAEPPLAARVDPDRRFPACLHGEWLRGALESVSMDEIIFVVVDAPDGGLTASACGEVGF